jgi:hypothetical protein
VIAAHFDEQAELIGRGVACDQVTNQGQIETRCQPVRESGQPCRVSSLIG